MVSQTDSAPEVGVLSVSDPLPERLYRYVFRQSKYPSVVVGDPALDPDTRDYKSMAARIACALGRN